MSRLVFIALLLVSLLAAGFTTRLAAQAPAANRENIEGALKLTQAAAAEYEMRIGEDEKPLDLQREPVLRWSNPDQGEVHGNIFLWTRDGRPRQTRSTMRVCGRIPPFRRGATPENESDPHGRLYGQVMLSLERGAAEHAMGLWT